MPDAIEIFESAEGLLKEKEYEIRSIQVLSLADSSGCPVYDCEFVNLAKDFGVLLITEDIKVLKHFPESAVSMKMFLESQEK